MGNETAFGVFIGCVISVIAALLVVFGISMTNDTYKKTCINGNYLTIDNVMYRCVKVDKNDKH